MAGQLHEHPLAELIREISAAGLSGALRLERERAKVAVYFDTGDVVYAGTNLRAYRLSECVQRWRVLTDEQIARAGGKPTDVEFQAALVDMGILNRDTVAQLLGHQVSEILCHALLWTEGSWKFDPRVRISTDMHVTLLTPELLIESARRLPPEFPSKRFKSTNESLFPVEDYPEDIPLLPTEAFVLTRVDRPIRIHELVSISSLPEGETLRIVYALALGGFLRRELWPKALTEDEVSKARAILANAKQPEVATEPEVKRGAASEAAPAEPVRDERAELEAMFSRLRLATNCYQMLGLVRPATDADVKRAYHSLAKQFHPDRFRKTVDDALHTRIEAAFVKIAGAYETLKNKQSRAAYDSQLLTRPGPQSTHVPPPGNAAASPIVRKSAKAPNDTAPPRSDSASAQRSAEDQFRQGLLALESGALTVAISCLGEAARLDPRQARYRAYYGRALAGEERLQRSAESELKAAIALDANNPEYHVMLGELYVNIGLLRRAQGELRRALALDPKNNEARRLLLRVS